MSAVVARPVRMPRISRSKYSIDFFMRSLHSRMTVSSVFTGDPPAVHSLALFGGAAPRGRRDTNIAALRTIDTHGAGTRQREGSGTRRCRTNLIGQFACARVA